MWLTTLSLVCMASFLCGAQAACTNFVEIPEANYDRNYSRIDRTDQRPLGFQAGNVPFNDPDVKDVCVTVNGVSGRHIEIAFETVPRTTLCWKDQSNANRGQCREVLTDCYRATADTMTFTFYCERGQGCSESDVTFWYRITKGPSPEEDTEDMWCEDRPEIMFPESLAPPPPGLIPPTLKPDKPVAASSRLTTSLGLLLLGLLAVAFRLDYA